ncbi:MAG: thiamine pyrophosphate-dependent dehydrogenase E1 component subunit alpha [Candidatus Omnitrophica bacterium]|nr:thiamine pyrophosphate-dependent dehydrogenase E1 component subunit alpha [Candidatus Omnitrophota bacterium]
MTTPILKKLYYTLARIRRFEEKIVEIYPFGKIRCPVHLCIGQEAIAAGVCAHLRRTDHMVSNHRNHGHLIAKGAALTPMFAELFGRTGGCSGGKGGSMHMIDSDHSSLGTSSIVAAGLPIALGTALASRIRRQKRVSVVFFGDGAVDEGTFYESLNFARLHRLAVIFVCENNFYSLNSPQKLRHANMAIHKITGFFSMPGFCINGNDVIEVWKSAGPLIERARRGQGPALIEAKTYRYYAHDGITDDTDKGFRDRRELSAWMKKCPVASFKDYLLKKAGISQEIISGIDRDIDAEIQEALDGALSSPYPGMDDLNVGVY